MTADVRRMLSAAGVAAGALLASPFLASLEPPQAQADVATLGPLVFDGLSAAFSYDTDTYAFDSFLSGSYEFLPYNLDVFYGTPGSGDFGAVFTIPLLFQAGYQDLGGVFTPFYSFNFTDFLPSDLGLGYLTGTQIPDGIASFGPFTYGDFSDTFSINTDTFAFDNYLTGTYNAVPFDLDLYYSAPDASGFGALFTVPDLFQIGYQDIAGAITPLFSLNPADFLDPQVGLSLI